MTRRFSKKLLRDDICKKYHYATLKYQEHAGKPYDAGNGYAQVPEGNTMAFMAYGQIRALKSIWADYNLGGCK